MIVYSFICDRLHAPLKRGFFRNIFTVYDQMIKTLQKIKSCKKKELQKKAFAIHYIKKNVTNYELGKY